MIDGVGLEPDIKADVPKTAGGINVSTIGRLMKTSNLRLNSEGKDVYNTEKILKANGYNVDTPDTKLDNKTYTAVRKFQKVSHLKVDGIVGVNTQTALNKVLDKLITQYDPQYAKAVEVLLK
jgi:carboxyl-terminal processing protease